MNSQPNTGNHKITAVAELVERVERIIAGQQLLADGDGALVAVSGGIDSMVLLHVLHALSGRHNWKLVVAHVNHQLRGRVADLDERFVARHATKLGLRCEVAREDVKGLARSRKLSIEMAARQLRHDFLARTARSLGIRRIFLAHHADDQVELFFLRLMRGSGPQGLGGMKVSAPSAAATQIRLLRPLLTTWKSELRAFAKARKISFREDATNDSTDILRNRIRHKLLPVLRKQLHAGIERTVLRSMELVRDEGDFVTAEAMEWLQTSRRQPFDRSHVALQRRAVQLQLLAHGIAPQFDHIERLRMKPGEWLAVGPGSLVRRTTSGRIERRSARTPDFGNGELTANLDARAAGSVDYAGLALKWRFMAAKKSPRRGVRRTEFFDANKVGDGLVLRHWRSGDRFQPIGLRCAVKLQDLFVNQKIPRECRHNLVLATTASGEIFWVEGLRIGENFKVTRATERVLEWRWRPGETLVAAPESEC